MTVGVVLAGGLSSRMGYDKASLMRKNQSMLDFSVDLLSQCSLNKIVVSGDKYDIPDTVGELGPLGGIYSVLTALNPSSILVIPIDMPLMTLNLLKQLINVGQYENKACIYHQHPLPLYLPNNSTTLATLKGLLASVDKKGPSIKQFLQIIGFHSLIVESNAQLRNCNTPEQWQTVTEQLSVDKDV